MKLHEWAVLYIKHKDVFARKLQDVKEDGDKITFTFSDKVITGYVGDELHLPDMKGETVVFALHTKANITSLINQWDAFSKQTELTVVFANPRKNEKLVIKPALHNKISEGDISQGIWSIANSATYV